MTFWEVIVLCVKYGPTVVSAIMKGADFIETMISLKKVDDANKAAKQTKDTSQLENIFNPSSDDRNPPAPGSH